MSSSLSYQSQILQSFSSLGYSPQIPIRKDTFHQILTQLYGRQYILDITEQLWDEVPINIHKEALVKDLVRVIAEGQSILVGKIRQIKGKLAECQKGKQIWERNYQYERERNQEIENKLEGLQNEIDSYKNQKDEYQEDLQLLTKPFGIYIHPDLIHNHQMVESAYRTEHTSNQLKYILYLSLIIFVQELLIINGKLGFSNLLLSVLTLSVFLFNFFNNSYVTLILWGTLLSIGLDVIWIVGWSSKYWNVGVRSEFSGSGGFYVVFTTVLNMVMKGGVAWLLYGFREVTDGIGYRVNVTDEIGIVLVAGKNQVAKDMLSNKKKYEDDFRLSF